MRRARPLRSSTSARRAATIRTSSPSTLAFRGPPLLRGLGRDDLAVVAADGGGVTVTPDGQDVLGAHEPVDQVQDVLDPAPVGQGVADGLDDLTLTERARPLGQTFGAGQPPVQLLTKSYAR